MLINKHHVPQIWPRLTHKNFPGDPLQNSPNKERAAHSVCLVCVCVLVWERSEKARAGPDTRFEATLTQADFDAADKLKALCRASYKPSLSVPSTWRAD